MLELHSSGQQAVLCNGTIDQRRIAEQLADSTDAADAVATACDRACSPGCFDGSTALEHPAAANDKAETDSSTFSLAQVPKAGNQALTPRLGDVQDHDQSPDRAVPEQQRQSVSHRVLAALQQREVAAAGARALGSMDLMIGSLDVHKSTADFCLLPGSHGEEQAACTTVELAAELNSSASPAGASAAAAAAAAAAVQRRHTMDAPHSCQDAQSYRPAPPRAATASANELRQSAVDGLKSFQLVIRTEGDWEDTASESAYSAAAGRRAAGGHELRRSRSHGSLADLLHQEKRTDVSELRKMWQQLEVQHAMKDKQGTAIDRLALRPHTQQQEASSSSAATAAAAAAAAQPSSLSRPINSTGGSRIPAFGSRLPSAPGVAPAAAAAAAVSQAPSRELQGPEACESPPTSPIGLTRRSSRGSRGTGISDCSDTGHPAAAAAGAGVAGAAVDASFVQGKMMGGLISRLDDMLQQELPAQVHSAPLGPAAMPAAGSDGINRQLF
ncbi:hypothetical protein OEZ85_006741 [Tetradesmus obliquus]|uniref:Uncharacterized protein n=1 Tax=Tetradesmus obliquus TaxID=3088 RepID=A0ABY8TVI4_TETOB|nr:hypothetical protein OEZ85_006741 [Tetradesmus obliquus]